MYKIPSVSVWGLVHAREMRAVCVCWRAIVREKGKDERPG